MKRSLNEANPEQKTKPETGKTIGLTPTKEV